MLIGLMLFSASSSRTVSQDAKDVMMPGVHEIQVTLKKYEFNPGTLRVKKGEQVRLILAGVYCELREQACRQIFVRELEALLRITHVGYYEAMAARPRVLTKACWARVCCEST